MSTPSDQQVESPLEGRRVAFVGKLGGLNRREARQLVRDHGGVPAERPDESVDLIVIGADELPLGDQEQLLDQATRQAAAEGRIEIISENQLWQRLGLVETQQHVRGLYTPAMLAQLLGVPVATVRRWHRRGLIVPVREVHRLPYFDFQEIATARRLAQLLAAGASPAAIEKQLAELAQYVPDAQRPLAQLSVIVEGRQILLRRGEGLVEPSGQLRFDFDALPAGLAAARSHLPPTLPLAPLRGEGPPPLSPEQLLQLAAQLEDEGQLEGAADVYRALLAATGPRAEVCFQLAELLYRMGDVTAARERYFQVLELDENYVEARANLGCVLAESGQLELAVAAFRGALRFHPDYPDAHYHLARTLDQLGLGDEAEEHWRQFLALAPHSPWADEARQRLDEPS